MSIRPPNEARGSVGWLVVRVPVRIAEKNAADTSTVAAAAVSSTMGCGASSAAPAAPDAPATAAGVLSAATSANRSDARKAAAAPLRAIFDQMDADGNGFISKAELQKKLSQDQEIQTLLESAGGSASYVFEQLDDDGDGKVTWAEFEGLLSPDAAAFVDVVAGPTALDEDEAPVTEAELKALFTSIDKDGTGTISAVELQQKLNADQSVQKLLNRVGGDGKSHVFSQLDEDGDGTITWNEFRNMLSEDGGAEMTGLEVSGMAIAGQSSTADALPPPTSGGEAANEDDELDDLLKVTGGAPEPQASGGGGGETAKGKDGADEIDDLLKEME